MEAGASSSSAATRPFTFTVPLSGLANPVTIDKSVLLPARLDPMTANPFPWATSMQETRSNVEWSF